MPRYDAIIFDLFGTLICTVTPNDYETMLGDISKLLQVPQHEFAIQWRAMIEERESGTLGNIDAVLRTTAAAAGGAPSYDQIKSAAKSWLRVVSRWLLPRENAYAVLNQIKQTGTRLGLLSNCSAEVTSLWPAGMLSNLFDATVFSCEVGAMKPDPRVYNAACDGLNVAPHRCMFVGDGGGRELTGAVAAGMQAILLRVPGEEHTWFDANYRQDALEWPGTVIRDLSELLPLV